jgi:hypothetical protein
MAKNTTEICSFLSPSQPINILENAVLRASDLSSSFRWDSAGA